ncbi:hypothetical protein N665_0090s0056 [Sinapis alba]|nr:hypothetical protein N665_0090s0056 [Sinapis alba]
MVADTANNPSWHFRRCRDQNLQQLISSISGLNTPTNGSEEDMTPWCARADVYTSCFSSTKTWKQIRVHKEKQRCSKVIWLAGPPLFRLPYTFTIWLAVVGDLLETDADPDRETTLTRLVEHKYDRLTFILSRLVFQTSIYYLWRERNERRHTEKTKSVSQLTTLIDKTVRNKIMSTHYFESSKLQGLLQRWFRGH